MDIVLLSLGRSEARDVDDLQLQTVGIEEEHRVIPRDVGVFLRLALELNALRAEPGGALGYYQVTEVEGERGETIWYLGGPGTAVGLREAQSESGLHDRYALGLHHLAFEADSRAQVDERADWLRGQGAQLESEPQEYTYIPGYYAVFFYDPDGMKLEILHVPALAA